MTVDFAVDADCRGHIAGSEAWNLLNHETAVIGDFTDFDVEDFLERVEKRIAVVYTAYDGTADFYRLFRTRLVRQTGIECQAVVDN